MEKMSKIIPDPNYPEVPIYGMNTYDSDKTMISDSFRGYYRNLTNTYPGTSQIQRKGTKEIAHSNLSLGFNNSSTVFKSKGVHFNVGGKDYVFVWSQSVTFRTEHHLEMWNVTDGTRTILESGKFENENVYFSMVKLYNSIYCTANYRMEENHSSTHRVLNKIIEYVDGQFIVRNMGIDESPIVQDRYVVETGADNVFDARHLAGSAVFNSRLWLLCGADGSSAMKSVHLSTDGKFWTTHDVIAVEYVLDETGATMLDGSGNPVVTDATFVKRYDFGTAVFAGKLWIFGGVDDAGTKLNDVWYTTDGTTWYLHRRSSGWSARYGFSTVEHSGRVYLAGGYDTAAKNDVWYTTDFTTWTQVTVATAFTARYGHTMLSYNGKMWILLGHGVTNTYSSTDGGANWTEVKADAGLGQREYHSSVVFENKMWILGGNASGTRQNNVYSSTDGDTWTTVDSSADWLARSGLSAQVFLNKIFVFCGYSGSAYFNDVWSSGSGSSWTPESSGLTTVKYYSYAATFIRRSDSLSKLASMDDYNYEAWETYNGQTVAGVDEIILLGSVSLSGTALTGVGTDFTELAVGQNIRIDGTPNCYQITGITDATNAAVSNDSGDSYTGKECALIPSIGDSVTIDQYEDGDTESIENIDYRVVIYNFSTTDTARIFHHIPFRTYESAIAKGATHVRIYRTLAGADITTAQGLAHKYLVDVAIKHSDSAPDGQYEYKVFRDGVSDDILLGESNQLSVTGLEEPVLGRFCTWAAGSLWIGGNPGSKGFWYKSENPTGKNPKKWSQFFNTTSNYVVCDPEDGQEDTGIMLFNGDLYFWKERKVFRLPNADMENNPIPVSTTIGCICPDTICAAEVPALGGSCIFFLSEIGPAVLTSGGTIRLLNEFKIGELYYDKTGVITLSNGNPTNSYTRNKVQAEFFNNSYIVTMGDSEDSLCSINTNKVFGMFFDFDQEARGGYKFEFGTHQTYGVVYEPTVFVKMNSYLLGLSHKKINVSAYRIAKINDRSVQQDVFLGGIGSLSYTVRIEPRFVSAGPFRHSYAECQRWKVFIDYQDEAGLTITAKSHFGKFLCPHSATTIRQEGIFESESIAFRDAIAGETYEGLVGRNFNLLIEKVVPSSGDIEYSGYLLDVDPIERDDEYIVEGSSVIAGKTFTVNANQTVEVNAYT